MKISSENQALLSRVASKFETYRRDRPSKRSPIPKELWQEAVALAVELSPARVARLLKLDASSLRREMRQTSRPVEKPRALSQPSDVVRVAPVVFQGAAALPQLSCSLEITRHDGTRLCLSRVSRETLENVVGQFLQASGAES